MNDGILKTRLASGSLNTFRIQAPLKPDGSGKVIGLDDKNRPSTVNLDAGAGPRAARVTPPYSPCVWMWRPISSS
jgi:hypothetical protein